MQFDLQQATTTSLSTTLLGYLPYAAPLLGYVLVRTFAVRATLQSMNRRAETSFTAEYLSHGGSAGDGDAPSTAPVAEPAFQRFSATDRIRLDDASERVVSRARWSSARSILLYMLALFGYVALQAFATMQGMSEGSSSLSFVSTIPLIVVAALTAAVALYVLYDFSAEQRLDGRLLLVVGVLLPIVSALAVRTVHASLPLSMLAASAAVLLMAQWFVRLRRAQRASGNLELLMLRVFNADRNTTGLFGPLAQAWRYVGTHFTVADPSYIRFALSLSSGRSYLLFMRIVGVMTVFAALLWALTSIPGSPDGSMWWQWTQLDSDVRKKVVTTLLWFLLIPLAIAGAMRSVRRRFIMTPAALHAKLQTATGARSFTADTFPATPLFCPDNVWKPAVHAMFDVSKVVLMDLRGFTAERRGCEYEVGAMLDRVPVARMLFLVDPGPAGDAVESLIRERWSAMRADSPNRANAEPVIRMYVSTPRDPRDVPQMVRLLMLGARADATPAPQIASLVPMAPRWAITRMLARISLFFIDIAERASTAIDMAVARPIVNRAAAVLLAVTAIVPLGINVRDAMAKLPDAATIAQMKAEAAQLPNAPIEEAAGTLEPELPIMDGVQVTYQPGKLCDASTAFSSTDEVATVAVTLSAPSMVTAYAIRALAFDTLRDGDGGQLNSKDFRDMGDWKPLHVSAFGAPTNDDPTQACVDMILSRSDGTFPTTANITGRVPVRFRDGASVVDIGALAPTDSLVRELDASARLRVTRTGDKLRVVVEGKGQGNWSAELKAPDESARPDIYESGTSQERTEVTYVSPSGYRGHRIEMTHFIDRAVPFALRGVKLTKCETCS